MRPSVVGPGTSKPKPPLGVHSSFTNLTSGALSQSTGSISPSTSAPSTPAIAASTAFPSPKHGEIKVFASEDDIHPLAKFDSNSSPQQILQSLKLTNGGLKIKGGEEVYYTGDSRIPPNDYVVIGSSGLRLRVTCRGNKLIVAYPFPTHQIQLLLEEIAARFSRFNTNPGQELKIAELRTLDGYLLNKYDRIMDVMHDNDYLEAIDFDVWIIEQTKLCKETWLRVNGSDFVDNTAKWCEIGKHAHGKLYIQIGKGNEVGRLELFEVEDLKAFAKEGQQQVLTMKGKEGNFAWHSSVSFVITNGHVTAVVLEVKSCSDARPTIKQVQISIENNQLQKGEVHQIQSAEDEETPDSRPLPPTKKLETPLETETAATAGGGGGGAVPVELATIQAFQKLKIEQLEQIFADQAWARDGVFNNNFYINFSFTNPNDTIVTIVKVKTEYLVADKWVTPNETAIGSKVGFYNYRWNWNSTNFSIDAHQVEQVAVLASIPVKAPQVDRLRRAHNSLPQPLNIRVTFTDDQGASSSILVTYTNPPHDLPTKHSIEKYNNKQYCYWNQLDDLCAESRHYICVAKVIENENKEYYEIRFSPTSSTYYYYQNEFRRLAFEGVKTGQDQIELDSLSSTKDGMETHAYALIDREKKKVYALKFTLSANGAYLEDYFRVEPLKYDK